MAERENIPVPVFMERRTFIGTNLRLQTDAGMHLYACLVPPPKSSTVSCPQSKSEVTNKNNGKPLYIMTPDLDMGTPVDTVNPPVTNYISRWYWVRALRWQQS